MERDRRSSLDSTLFRLTLVTGAILISSRGLSKWWRSKTLCVTVTNATVTPHVYLNQIQSRPRRVQPQRRRNGYQRSYRSHLRACACRNSGTQVLSLSPSFGEDGAHGAPPGTQNQHAVWAESRYRRVHVHLSVPYCGEAAGWSVVAERCGRGH